VKKTLTDADKDRLMVLIRSQIDNANSGGTAVPRMQKASMSDDGVWMLKAIQSKSECGIGDVLLQVDPAK
jgi:hypothetical protein